MDGLKYVVRHSACLPGRILHLRYVGAAIDHEFAEAMAETTRRLFPLDLIEVDDCSGRRQSPVEARAHDFPVRLQKLAAKGPAVDMILATSADAREGYSAFVVARDLFPRWRLALRCSRQILAESNLSRSRIETGSINQTSEGASPAVRRWRGKMEYSDDDEDARVQRQLMSGLNRLTSRERQVLEMMIRGGTHKSVARELMVSPRTAEVHSARARQKLGNLNWREIAWRLGRALPPEEDGG